MSVLTVEERARISLQIHYDNYLSEMTEAWALRCVYHLDCARASRYAAARMAWVLSGRRSPTLLMPYPPARASSVTA